MNLLLSIHQRIELGNHLGLSRRIEVVDVHGAAVASFLMMCGAIDEMTEADLSWCLSEIEKLESGEIAKIDGSTEAYEFFLEEKHPVSFEFQFGKNGPERGGEVSLNQFKFAVQVFLEFLQDSQKKSIKTPFPS